MSGRVRFLPLALVLLAVFSSVVAEDPPSQSSSDSAGAASCRRLDAGIRIEDKLYLFSGDEYMILDHTGNETSVGPISDWGGLSHSLDAAFTLPGDWKHYFIEGNNAYTYEQEVLEGPLNSVEVFGRFFEGGIDAAGNRDYETYVFKDCFFTKLILSDMGYVCTDPDTIPLAFPCKIDAAFQKSQYNPTMIIIKNDKMYEWGPRPFEVYPGRPVSDVYTMRSWTLCASN